MSDDVRGRVDILASRLVEEVCKRAQAKTGFDFWNGLPNEGQSGMKQITEDLIDNLGIPRVPLDIPRTLAAGLAGLIGGRDRAVKRKPGRRAAKGTKSHRRAIQRRTHV